MLVTPPLGAGILAGITRAQVLRGGRRVGAWRSHEADLPATALDEAAEAFITSTVRGLVPVKRIDAQAYGPPGPVTQAVIAAYAECMARSVGSRV